MNKVLTLLLLLSGYYASAQITGTVSDENGNPLSFVNIFIENTYNSTVSNDLGKYELNVQKPGNYTIVFQYLGFKAERRTMDIVSFPHNLNITMTEEGYTLAEVVIDPKKNPADEIIRNTIAARKANSEKTARFKADFYSRGIFRIKDMPETLLGQKLDMFDDMLDSTRSGILYLSETVSKVVFQKPDKMKETIIASKVSGNDNGFSFNDAASANFDFYENYIPIEINVVSPIADNAFNYYRYKFEGSTFNENSQQIFKIKAIPKRDSEPAMEGYIYIVDDSWSIYAVDLSITGKAMQNPAVNLLTIKQSFSYNNANNIWVKNTQTLDFVAGMLGINISGRFTYVFNNYEFEEKFDKKTFTREVLSFEKDANKKDDTFWEMIRPVPLTEEERTDYIKKDILQTKKKSAAYLDSVDRKSNKFRLSDLGSGYSYKNSFDKWSLRYDGIIRGISFNTVQGWNISTGFSYTAQKDEDRTYTFVGARFNYGLSEKKLRGTVSFTHKFNNIDKSTITVSAGSMAAQFNSGNPISPIINTVSTLFFKDNYMKLYERNFANAYFAREIVNGVFANIRVDYSQRKPLFNTTDYAVVSNDKDYTSNNPLAPFNYETPAFKKHFLAKASLSGSFNFGQEYISRPDGKFNMRNEKFPVLSVSFEKGFAGSESEYEFEHLSGRFYYNLTLGNKGVLGVNVKGGKFFNAADISFVDYRHFNGNQTHVATADRYLNVFNLLPYYSASTNNSYFELHSEHNDRGYVMNKIPLLNKLQSTLVLGYHTLAIPERNPYHEFSIGLDNLGFGKFRLFRFDYVRSYQHGYIGDGVVFGLKFLDIIE
ncbi:MAG TPA: DUF5686 and carboxypeptidase regulatory-like domain-containing protein [Flavobacterium sp.]|jgi:hypothetical protein